MKKLFYLAAAAMVAIAATACGGSDDKKSSASELKTVGDSVSYYMGRVYGANIFSAVQEQAGGKAVKADFLAGLRQGVNATDIGKLQQDAIALNDQMEKATDEAAKNKAQSQLAGIGTGMQIKQMFDVYEQQFELKMSREIFLKAFEATFSPEVAPDVTVDSKVLEGIASRLDAKYSGQLQQRGAANAAAGAKYIEEQMAADKSIKRTESGLAYKMVKNGSGARLTGDQTACVKYVGKHIDGTVFDDGGGQTVEFKPSQVVPGFGEGLKLMRPGSKIVLYIPGNLAYGESGTPGGPIGPNETLVFEVELVGVK